MYLIWVLLALHFIFYAPFFFLFLAFIRVTVGQSAMYISIAFTLIFASLDFYILYTNFNYDFIFYYLIVCYLSSLTTTLGLWFSGKLDITIWLPFSIIFSPLILPFTLLFVYVSTSKARIS